jgi:hypothetical protein
VLVVEEEEAGPPAAEARGNCGFESWHSKQSVVTATLAWQEVQKWLGFSKSTG